MIQLIDEIVSSFSWDYLFSRRRQTDKRESKLLDINFFFDASNFREFQVFITKLKRVDYV